MYSYKFTGKRTYSYKGLRVNVRIPTKVYGKRTYSYKGLLVNVRIPTKVYW